MNKALQISIYALVIIGLLWLLPLGSTPVSAQNVDPSSLGPLTVAREEYNWGDEVFTPTDFPPVELRGSVHYPTNWTGGPLPLLVFLHGKHVTCFNEATNNVKFKWPCTGDATSPIDSFKGYDYIARALASNGYYVVSISANGINANDGHDPIYNGAKARAELVQKHLKLWETFNTTGGRPFDTKFVGKIDMQRIGTMGHSRGGEGVVKHFMLNRSLGSPYGIKAVFALAPLYSKTNHFLINNVPLAVLLPYCDGDVTNLGGVQLYDGARYNVPGDTAPKHTILVVGANHNFYNTTWTPSYFLPGSVDDFEKYHDSFCKPGGSGRLTEAQQRATGLTYVAAFLRAYVGGESQFLPLLTGAVPALLPDGVGKVYVSFHAPDEPASRRDVNRLSDDRNLNVNTMGGAVTPTSLWPYDVCGGASPTPGQCLTAAQFRSRQPHTSINGNVVRRGLNQLRMGWNDASATLSNELPSGHGDVTQFQALQFRASVNFEDSRNANLMAQNFQVALKDGAGMTASVRVANFSSALFVPPGDPPRDTNMLFIPPADIDLMSPVPKVVLNTVRLPLSAFANINLADVRSVEFKFDQPRQGTLLIQGALLITDIAFVSAAHITLPVFSSDACLKDETNGSELRLNTVTGNYVFCYAGGLTISGVGKVVTQGNIVSLAQGANETDRRLVVTMDRSTGRGTASLQTPAGSLLCSITDRNMTNRTCSCAIAP